MYSCNYTFMTKFDLTFSEELYGRLKIFKIIVNNNHA